MKTITRITGSVFVLSALALSGSLYADVPTPLDPGETINVTGTADAAPTSCSGTGPVSCPTLRDAVVYANGNGNGATKYDIINLPAGTYTLTVAGTGEAAAADGDLDINEPVNIVGAGVASTTIDGGGDPGIGERIFTINGVAVAIEELTMTNGFAKFELGGAIFNDEKSNLALTNCAITNSTATWDLDYTTDTSTLGESGTEPDGIDGTALLPEGTKETQGSGGAIYSKDVLTIENCVFRGNVAENMVDTGVPDPDPHHEGNIFVKVGNGGAINASQYTVINNSTFGSDDAIDVNSNRGINGGALFMTGGNPLEITNSTFSYNYAISGGGVCNVSPSAPTTITNSTISGNHVTDSGAGIETNADMELLNVTIANNRKDSSTKGSGLNTGPSVNITAKNVLFDDNMANTGFVDPANCGAKSGGFAINTQGGNVSSDETCDLNVLGSDQENATINLIALADNGGLTLTHALPDPLDAASAAVDKALNAGCPNNDQRGNIRPFNATQLPEAICDSGAYELYVERADLHIENMTAPDKVLRGEQVQIDIVVDNGSTTNAADGVVLTTTLPLLQLSYVSDNPSVGTCSEAGGVVTCDFGTLAASAQASVSIVATADTLKPGVIVSTEVTSTSPPDPDTGNNSHSVTFDIVEATDLEMTAGTATPAALGVGGIATVSITVVNNGPVTATGVTISGPLPSLLSFVQGVGCDDVTVPGDITCSVGTLTTGASADVVFEVKAEAVGTTTVSAYATADQVELSPNDNGGEAVISIIAAGDSGGGFCSYNPDGRFDPVLPALLVIALSLLGYRRLGREGSR